MLTGGGSGGHITPILAVADELKHRTPNLHLVYIGKHGDKLGDIPASHPSIDQAFNIRAGKLRRYHGQWWRHVLDLPLIIRNIRDGFWVIIGIWQSFWLLKKLKPNVIFIKGGFVGVPVGVVAGWLHIPYITHDSDTLPGLANKIIAKRAHAHAVGGPKHLYPYPAHKTHEVGVPLNDQYKPVTYQLQSEYRKGLGIKSDVKVICVTGGGLGARRLNDAVAAIVPTLLLHYPSLVVLHISGRDHQAGLESYYKDKLSAEHYKHVLVKGFVNDLYRYTASADVVITRAGATQLAELATQRKAAIVVPNPILTGGHQTKNAQQLEKSNAIIVLSEEKLTKDHTVLYNAIRDLLDHQEKRHKLAQNLGELAKPDATKRLADIILETDNNKH